VREIESGTPYPAGHHLVRVDLDGAAAGVYFCEVATPAGKATRRLVHIP
jgi:hypothetical protein